MATLAEPIVHGVPVEFGAQDQHAHALRHDGHRDVERRPRVHPGSDCGVSHRRCRPRIALCHPRGIPASALHRDRVLLPEPAGSELRRLVLVGEPDAEPLRRMGVGAGSSSLQTSSSARPRRSSPAPTRCNSSTASAGSARMRRTTTAWIAVVGVLWLLLVTFMVARGIRVTANFQWVLVFIEYLIVLAFAALGDRQDHRRASCGASRIRQLVQPAAVARSERTRDRIGAGGVLLLGLGHRGQCQRGVQGRE